MTTAQRYRELATEQLLAVDRELAGVAKQLRRRAKLSPGRLTTHAYRLVRHRLRTARAELRRRSGAPPEPKSTVKFKQPEGYQPWTA